jgi:hypothetical protein
MYEIWWAGGHAFATDRGMKHNLHDCMPIRWPSCIKEAVDELPARNWGAGAGLYAPVAPGLGRSVVEPARDEGRGAVLPVCLLAWLNQ